MEGTNRWTESRKRWTTTTRLQPLIDFFCHSPLKVKEEESKRIPRYKNLMKGARRLSKIQKKKYDVFYG